MRKIHAALLAGAVVVGAGAIAGLAAFAPSVVGEKAATHELTLQLPAGGTETISYTGKVAPMVTLRTPRMTFLWPALSYDWTMPSFVAPDPFIADINRHLDMLGSMPLVIRSVPDQPLNAALSNPSATSYSIISETVGNGVCTRFTQITKAASDAKPQVVSQTSGNCATGSDQAANSQPTPPATSVNLRTTSRRAMTQIL